VGFLGAVEEVKIVDEENQSHESDDRQPTSNDYSSSPVAMPSDTPTEATDATSGRLAVEIVHGEPLTDRKSTFQAHVAVVHSVEEVAVRCQVFYCVFILSWGTAM